ncbi:bifunctional DNA primase/polymerase [Nonomuraea sp. NN258]|uniref:bifunctional DNA primase/polymerase n=1 Tax=Nonomuraea antri TaxID=2730852 RepID=UPI00156859F1|nr:bifunctional DNA primase/polymerase [Nonomuraea antri]NRQ34309.1 bifunctional DNA primase/polymerase [Nonomuraea antri]
MTRDLTRYALAAAARGWHVFPLAPNGKTPPRGFTAWQDRTTTDPATIRRIWQRPYNVGIATGPSGLVVLDLDQPKPGEQPPPQWNRPGIRDGADVLAALCDQDGQPLPLETFQVRTRRGGLHLYFTTPPGETLTNTQGSHGNGLGWLIDTRAHGGYVVGPGSHVTDQDATGTYEVLHPIPPALLPAWLAERLRPAPLPPQKPVTVPLASDRRGSYIRAAVLGELQRVAGSPPHGHNNALYLAAVALGQLVAGGELDAAAVITWLTEAATQVGQPYREAQRTIASGLRAGARRPRTVAA